MKIGQIRPIRGLFRNREPSRNLFENSFRFDLDLLSAELEPSEADIA